MELTDLQLGDKVQVVVLAGYALASQPVGTMGIATVIGFDPQDRRNPVMVGYNKGEAPFWDNIDNYSIPGATYIPNVRTSFQYSAWTNLASIVCKITSAETPCVSAPMQVPAVPSKTPQPEPAFDFHKYNSTLPGRRHPYENDYH
jgi:hypothetical protein